MTLAGKKCATFARLEEAQPELNKPRNDHGGEEKLVAPQGVNGVDHDDRQSSRGTTHRQRRLADQGHDQAAHDPRHQTRDERRVRRKGDAQT
jgi:hypothetical protein